MIGKGKVNMANKYASKMGRTGLGTDGGGGGGGKRGLSWGMKTMGEN